MSQANYADKGNARSARWTASNRLTLAIALAMLLLSAVQLGYRSTLPTDGWSVMTGDPETSSWVYVRNLVGAPSPLQTDDVLLWVAGQSLRDRALEAPPMAPPANWAAGQQVTVTVLRAGQEISFLIPVVH